MLLSYMLAHFSGPGGHGAEAQLAAPNHPGQVLSPPEALSSPVTRGFLPAVWPAAPWPGLLRGPPVHPLRPAADSPEPAPPSSQPLWSALEAQLGGSSLARPVSTTSQSPHPPPPSGGWLGLGLLPQAGWGDTHRSRSLRAGTWG